MIKEKRKTSTAKFVGVSLTPLTLEHLEYIERSEGMNSRSSTIAYLALEKYNQLMDRNLKR